MRNRNGIRSTAFHGAILVLVAFVGWLSAVRADAPAAAANDVDSASGKVLFEDSFERAELGPHWDVHPDSFEIVDGVLVASQRPDADHGAVSQSFVDFRDAVLEFSFRFEGSTSFNVVIDDRHYKDSHAGHICRVTVNPKRIALQDDKTGAMKNDIFEGRRQPGGAAKFAKLLAGKSKAVSVDLERGRWYTMQVAIEGDMMRVRLDGQPLAQLSSDGIAHPTKTDFGFTVNGRSLHLDNVRLSTKAD